MLPPVSKAKQCRIAAEVTVDSRTSLGKGCFVGEATEEGSIFLEEVQLGEGTTVRNSIKPLTIG
jgi:NDP-sugar pyrophosphorylase family protein